jgi:hypothetical protein
MDRYENGPAVTSNRTTNQNTLQRNYSLNPLNEVLARCEDVRPAGEGYRANCPNEHRSRGSLAIREADNGSVLIHCHSGCSALEVLHGLGLELSDLFVNQNPATMTPQQRREYRDKVRQSGWKTALELLPLEISIVECAAVQLLKGKPLNEADHLRLEQAGRCISSARVVLCDR